MRELDELVLIRQAARTPSIRARRPGAYRRPQERVGAPGECWPSAPVPRPRRPLSVAIRAVLLHGLAAVARVRDVPPGAAAVLVAREAHLGVEVLLRALWHGRDGALVAAVADVVERFEGRRTEERIEGRRRRRMRVPAWLRRWHKRRGEMTGNLIAGGTDDGQG